MIHATLEGTLELTDDADATRTLVIAADDPDRESKIAVFFNTALTMPAELPMHQLRMFLIATNRKAQVVSYLNTLPAPKNLLAVEEFNTAPTFSPSSALGRAVQGALGLNDADYATAMRTAATATIDDYGVPKPGVMGVIARFFLGQ